MIEKLKLEQNPMSPVLETLKQVCPGAINEDGTVDFDVLKTELSDSITEGKRERYEFDWVGKENAKRCKTDCCWYLVWLCFVICIKLWC